MVESRGGILKNVYSTESQEHEISPQRVLFNFESLFIEGIWGWKLNNNNFYYYFYH